MMEKQMDEQAENYADVAFGTDFDSQPRCNNEGEEHIDAFKAGYTAALSDVEAKVSGLVEALEKFNTPLHQQNHYNCLSDRCEHKFAMKALAEFTAQADKDGE